MSEWIKQQTICSGAGWLGTQIKEFLRSQEFKFDQVETLHTSSMCRQSYNFSLAMFVQRVIRGKFILQSKTILRQIRHTYLHFHKIVEGLYFHSSLSVCLSVHRAILVNKIPAVRMHQFLTRFSLNGCLTHWFEPYWNRWPWVKGQGHSDVIPIFSS